MDNALNQLIGFGDPVIFNEFADVINSWQPGNGWYWKFDDWRAGHNWSDYVHIIILFELAGVD